MNKIDKIINQMTLDEKLNTLHGTSFWLFNSYKENGKGVVCSDGPNGVRKMQNVNMEEAFLTKNFVKCTTFPTGSNFACSFDQKLIKKMGVALAHEFQFYKINVALGPAACIKRNPLCGRNFEYLSEDPLLSGYIAGSYIKGLESTGCGTSLKHYVANNQEYGRQVNSSTLSLKCLRDIYTKGFEIAVREGNPASIMVSYNKINGVYACENSYIMEDVMRKEIGYKGLFISDWTAVNDPCKALHSGLDVEMPERDYEKGFYEKAFQEGKIKDEDLTKHLNYYIPFINKYSAQKELSSIDFEKHLKIAIEVAENSIVLAKNEDNFFPLNTNEEIIVLGLRARDMSYYGGGSSATNSYYKPDFISVLTSKNISFKFDSVYDDKGNLNLALLEKIKNQKVLVFLGCDHQQESEGYDRKDMKLPDHQLELMSEISKITNNVGVIVESGSVVELPFLDNIKGLFIPYFAGEGEDFALYNLIYGYANPSGKLAETWINKYDDCPSSLTYDKDIFNSYYDEDIYVGYRYYDKYKINVNFPFGFGLSYSKFKLKLLRVSINSKDIKCEVEVTNFSEIKGKEVVQIYIGKKDSSIYRVRRELVAFSKVEVYSHSKKKVVLSINYLDLRVFDPTKNKQTLEDGDYELYLCNSSREEISTTKITLSGEKVAKYDFQGPDHNLVFKEDEDMNLLVTSAIKTNVFKRYLESVGLDEEKLKNTFFKDGFLKNPIRCLAGLGILKYHEVELILPKIIKELRETKK